jgi:hypothetical protein
MRGLCAIILSLILVCPLAEAAQVPASPGTNDVAQPPSAMPEQAQKDLQDLRQDLQKMKVLVQQMEQNLAFVDTTQSPLKRQFQLEIDMWKTLIAGMESRLNSPKR